jgi:peroxiredoxin
VQKHYAEIRQAGGEVLVISSSRPEALAVYLTANPWPFPVVADPSLAPYHAFGLGRTSWRTFLKPRILGHFLRLMLRGWLPRRPYDREDLLQLGGDFVLDGQRRLVLAHPSRDPTDRPAPDVLVEAVLRIASPDHP